jgi:hypothetical protein
VHMFNKDVAHIMGLEAEAEAEAAQAGAQAKAPSTAPGSSPSHASAASAPSASSSSSSSSSSRPSGAARGAGAGAAWIAAFADRPNVLLLGDGPGDVTMANGLPAETVLRVGFLNDNVEKLLDKYVGAGYDVLITDDGPAYGVVELLEDTARTLHRVAV